MSFDGAREIDARNSSFQVIHQTLKVKGITGKRKLTRFVRKLANVSRTGLLGPSEVSQKAIMEIEPQSSRHVAPEIDTSSLPQQEAHSYYSFPLPPTSIVIEPLETPLELQLPPVERAIALCHILQDNLSWMFSIVSREYLIVKLIPAVYNRNRMDSSMYSLHDFALLLTVMAIGVLVDLDLKPHDENAQLYIRLAWSAARSVPAMPSIATVKCLHLLSIYHAMTGNGIDFRDSHRLLISAWKFFHHINFHEDPLIRNINGKEAYDRRAYFWILLQPILWQSHLTASLPSILATPVDCNTLSGWEEKKYETEKGLGFGAWSSEFIDQCLLPVTRAVLDSNPPDYQIILALDERIGAFPVPSSLPDNPDLPSTMQYFVRSHYRDLTLMFLHRDFFKRALTDNPTDPLISVHSHSFTTAYKSACAILDSTINQYAEAKSFVPRVWRIWTNAFCAAVIIGTVAILTPNANFEQRPLRKLEDACIVFENAAKASPCASRALPKLLKMLNKASYLAGQVMSWHQMDLIVEPANLQRENVVLEDIWSSRMYEDVMKPTQTC